jgi:hypothetical protein
MVSRTCNNLFVLGALGSDQGPLVMRKLDFFLGHCKVSLMLDGSDTLHLSLLPYTALLVHTFLKRTDRFFENEKHVIQTKE